MRHGLSVLRELHVALRLAIAGLEVLIQPASPAAVADQALRLDQQLAGGDRVSERRLVVGLGGEELGADLGR